MNLRGPGCGAQFSLETVIQGRRAREAIVAALHLPRAISSPLVSYLTLFRPAKRTLSFDRVEKLFSELRESIESGVIKRNGMTYPAPIDIWCQGLEAVVQARDDGRLRLPLKSHGYLLEIIATLAGKAAGAAEREKHEALRAGRRGDRKAAPAAPTLDVDEYGLDRNAPLYKELRESYEQTLPGVHKSGTG